MSVRALLLLPEERFRTRRVAGLTLLGRAVRVARAALGGEGADVRVAARDDAERALAIVEVDPASVSSVGEAASLAEGPLLVCFANVVVDRRVVTELVKHGAADDEVVTAKTDAGPSHTYLVGSAHARTLTSEALASLTAFETWVASHSPRAIAPTFDTKSFAFAVVDADSEERAIDALFLACIKPIDGLVSRNLNRKISLRISRLLVNTNVTPNHVTVLCLVIAVVSALVALRGDYLSLAIAGVLFQLNSVLDGVDGELARVKWAFSKLGEKLDSVGDDLSNFSYFGAMVYVAHAHGEWVLALVGGTGLVLWALYLVFLYGRLRGTGGGDVMVVSQAAMTESSGFWQRAIEIARLLVRRDAFVFLAFVLAVLGRATYILPVVLGGGTSTFVFAVRETLRGMGRRDA